MTMRIRVLKLSFSSKEECNQHCHFELSPLPCVANAHGMGLGLCLRLVTSSADCQAYKFTRDRIVIGQDHEAAIDQ